MSILIKGMEMPKNCIDCVFGWNGWCHRINSRAFVEVDMRRHDCPLVELPPHGDLIDRDAAIRSAFKGEQNIYCWDEIEEAIDSVPAIIESEE